MKKQKGSSPVSSGPTKRRTLSQQGPGNTTVQKPVPKPDPRIQVHCHPLNRLGANMGWQCKECMRVNEVCAALPGYACERCQRKKNKCSLMPPNPGTGKTDRCALEQESLQDFRIRQTEELCRAGIKQGKQRARSSPGVKIQGSLRCDLHEVVVTSNDDKSVFDNVKDLRGIYEGGREVER